MASTSTAAVPAGPGAAAAAAGAAGGAAEPEGAMQVGGVLMRTLNTLLRVFLFWSVIKYFFLNNSPSPATTTVTTITADGRTVTTQQHVPPIHPAWMDHTHFDIHVYVNTQHDWSASSIFAVSPALLANITAPYVDSQLVWHEDDVQYEAETWSSPAIRSLNTSLTEPFLSQALSNHTLYAHIYLSRRGYPHAQGMDCRAVEKESALRGKVSECWNAFEPLAAFHTVQQLNVYKPPPKVDKRKNLLTGDAADDATADSDSSPPAVTAAASSSQSSAWLSYWKPTLHVRLVHDFSTYPSGAQVPHELKDSYVIDPSTSAYYPIVYVDYFWLLSSHHLAVNSSLTSLPLLLTYSPMSMMKYRMERSMEESWRLQQSMGTHREEDTEGMKRVMLESNPYLLAVTMCVSMLHMLFDFLAFKNDISFWRNNKSTAGLSGRAVVLNCACMAVVFLYLLDNETSWMVVMSSGIGLLIECWKIPKLFTVAVDANWPFLHLTPKRVATDAEGRGLTEQDQLLLLTHKYDSEAMRYLSYVLYPLVLAYAIYSLLYNTHKGWYSFVLTTLVGSVYTFGFIQMTPQLYINYKLKSVAAMPWRQMTYKCLNTVIDDLFAFVITVPTLHRLSVFRDDVIFAIFLYQRWIYRTDSSRPNEFGVSGNDLKEAEKRRRDKEAEAARTGDGGVGPVTAVLEEKKDAVVNGPTAAVRSEEVKADDSAEGMAATQLRQRKVAAPAASVRPSE